MAKVGETKAFDLELENGDVLKLKFQHVGAREVIKLMTDTKGKDDELTDYLLDHVIFTADNKKVTYETFEELENWYAKLQKVIAEAITFLTDTKRKSKTSK